MASEEPNQELITQSTYIRDLPTSEKLTAYELLRACERSNGSKVKEILEDDLLPSYSLQDEDGWTALHYATASGNIEIVERLLQVGALWSMPNHLGLTAGDVAFSMNDQPIYQLIVSHGLRSEMLRRVLESKPKETEPELQNSIESQNEKSSASDNATFLGSRLTYKTTSTGQDVCIDSEGNGVMLGWEDEIMKKSAEFLCAHQPNSDSFELSVLNVGFGLGLIDSYLQTYKPHRHVIIEAHPDVLNFMEQNGWHQRSGVEIYRGRWQDFFNEIESGQIEANFDGIYWDTFSENYDDLKVVFDHVFNLLSGPQARFSWFHGLGATSVTLYDIYTQIAELDLHNAGLKTIWHEVNVEGGEAVWEGIRRRYWNIPCPYRLPICMYDM
ncbi:S-adenosyl-L-methionine-dependent methyltransferase [Melampsora americana]|nr:S-adenosyl-L-methionine-dependent methyltransferase [Melampsora americana]